MKTNKKGMRKMLTKPLSLDFTGSTRLKEKLNQLRPLAEMDVNRLRNDERIEMVYASNALEGNTLTISETQWILEKGMTVDGKSMREHLEVLNLNEAIDYIEDLVRGNISLNERELKQIHYLVYNKLTDAKRIAGQYRNFNVKILGSNHKTTDFTQIQADMDRLFEWIEANQDKLHPIEYAAILHQKFVGIHPFGDGNGRTARLLMNFSLTSKGYPAIIIKPDVKSRNAYIEALEHAHLTGDTSLFVSIVKTKCDEKMKHMIHQIERVRAYEQNMNKTLSKPKKKPHLTR